MSRLPIFLLAAVAASSATSIGTFESFQMTFQRTYATESERLYRQAVFQENLEKIEKHNSNPHKSYTLGINQFADLTAEEMISTRMGALSASSIGNMSQPRSSYDINVEDLPASKDWRDEGAITAVKNQLSCGSCWAFSAVQQVESYYKIETNKDLIELSTQQLVSCSKNPYNCGGTGGCEGSVSQLAFNYVTLYGIVSSKSFPYTSGAGDIEECNFDAIKNERVAYIRGQETLPRNDLNAVLDHLANRGPLGIALDASKLHLYESGIFDGCDYEENIEINHAVQLVGYGESEEGKYWIVRNSWDSQWGENGYVRMKREDQVVCGTNFTPDIGTKCENDGVKTQTVCGMCGLLFDAAYPIGIVDVSDSDN